MVPATSQLIWQIGWLHRTWITFAAHPTIRRHRASAVKQSCWKEKGSNETQSKNDACSTKRKPYKLKPDEPVAPVNHAAISRNLSDDGRPYHGTEQSLLDLMEGRIDLLVSTIPPTLPQIKQGTVRALAVMSDKRSGLLPDRGRSRPARL